MITTLIPFSNTIFGLKIVNKKNNQYILIEIQNAINENNALWSAEETSITKSGLNNQYILGANPEESIYDKREIISLNYDLPSEFDWRNVDGIDWTTPIRNQKSCGSCVAFGVLASLESVLQIKSNNTYRPDLSEANLFFCGGGSCSQGWQITDALNCLKNNGASEEKCFEYQPIDMDCNQGCSNWENKVVKIKSYGSVPVQLIKEYLITKGPLITSFVVYEDFYYYKSGIYEHVWGSSVGLHCVAIFGYNDVEDYWIVKNSWGNGWGEEGWFRIKYRKCGIDQGVKYIELGDNNPPLTPDYQIGSKTGIAGDYYTFTSNAEDPDYNGLYYLVNWGDGKQERTEKAYPNKETVTLSHNWSVKDKEDFNIKVKSIDVYGLESNWSDSFKVTIINNKPNKPSKVQGNLKGVPEIEYEFSSKAIDPDGHQLYYLFDWGDGTVSNWLGPYGSGETINATHTWNTTGQFKIKVKVKDEHEAESEWSDPAKIAMSKNLLKNKFEFSNLFFRFSLFYNNLNFNI